MSTVSQQKKKGGGDELLAALRPSTDLRESSSDPSSSFASYADDLADMSVKIIEGINCIDLLQSRACNFMNRPVAQQVAS